MKIKKILILFWLLATSSASFAYSPMLLSPAWFKALYQNLNETKADVWRGTVVSYIGGTTISVKDNFGKITEVTLLHLATKTNSSKADIHLGANHLQNLVGSQIYVLSKVNKDSVNAKIIDSSGNDINLNLIKTGVFDVNTTSLLGKREKNDYLDAAKEARLYHRGIWS